MNKLVKNRILIISISLVLLVLINIAVSYSYYLGKVEGNETGTTLSFTSAGVIIEYQNNSGSITDTNIIPGWSTTKTFKVKSTMKANEGNNNDSKLGYSVKMIVDSNDFPTNSIAYSLAQGSKTGNGQAMEAATDVGIATGANSEGILLGTGYFVVGDNEHNYTLTIKYMDSETVDGNKNFGIHLVVETVKAVTVTVDVNGGVYTSSTTKYIPLGLAVEIEEPTKEGYKFNGWTITNGVGSTIGNKILANSLAITVQAQYIVPRSFADDDWATIVANVRSNPSVYAVGDTKEIAIDGFKNEEENSNGLYTVRVANNTTPSECSNTGFSQTACGFVVEFVDIIEKRLMTPARTYNGTQYDWGTNLGGWPATEMRTYLNGDTDDHLTYNDTTNGTTATLFSKLPSDLRNAIIDTTVVSGHGSSDSYSKRDDGNWETRDKIYLLSTKEVQVDGSRNQLSDRDSAYNNTRQLDYYSTYVNSDGTQGVTTSNYHGGKKNYNGTADWWWLRTANLKDIIDFFRIDGDCGWVVIVASSTSGGLAPAFRIG